MYRGISILLLLSGLPACLDPGPEPASGERPIIGGQPTADDPEVVALIANDGTGRPYCTGTIISPRHVLTAAHCIGQADPAAIYICPDMWEYQPPSECYMVLAYGGVHVHPDYDPETMRNDIAVLEVLFSEPVTPKRLPTGPLPEMAEGTTARIVGYGYSVPGNDSYIGTRRTGTTTITHVGAHAPGTAGPNPQGLSASTFQNAAYPNTCQGDSGGPTFWPAGTPDVEVVVGVTSWGDPACSEFGVNEDVGAHLCWLASVGVPTAECAPAGDAGVADADASPGADASPEGPDGGASAPEAAYEIEPDSGGCQVAPAGRGNFVWLLLAMLPLLRRRHVEKQA